jgi:regulator of replication initiation timing
MELELENQRLREELGLLRVKLGSETYKTPSPGGDLRRKRKSKPKSPYGCSKASHSKMSEFLRTSGSSSQAKTPDKSPLKPFTKVYARLGDRSSESFDGIPAGKSSFGNQSTRLEETEKQDHAIMHELTELRSQVETLSKCLTLVNSSSQPDVTSELSALRRENAELKRKLDRTPRARVAKRSLSRKKSYSYMGKDSIRTLGRSKSKKRLCNHCLFLMSKGFASSLCQRHNKK